MYQSAALHIIACATAVVFAIATPEARAAEPVAPVACEAGFKCITETDANFVGPRRPAN